MQSRARQPPMPETVGAGDETLTFCLNSPTRFLARCLFVLVGILYNVGKIQVYIN